VARALAATLRYRLVDDELPRLIAERLRLTPDAVEGLENRTTSFGERLLAGLAGALPEVTQLAPPPEDDLALAYCREAERLIRAAAAEGDVIILGRLGNAVLGPRPDVVRTFVFAAYEWRVASVMASLDCSVARARSEIARIDDARRAFAREYYRVAWGDPHSYDLLVDTGRYGVAGAAEIIAAAVRVAAASA
jgi:cytidylate kinase